MLHKTLSGEPGPRGIGGSAWGKRLIAVPAAERQDVRAIYATSGTRSERMFRRAARHSRLVRFLRVGLPVGLVVALGLIVIVTYFNPLTGPTSVSLDHVAISGTKINMEHPRLTGFTSDLLPYEVTAWVASQDLANPDVIEFTDPRAQLHTEDQGIVEIKARKGIYDTKADLLRLVDNILVQSTKGHEARLQEATIDIKKGTIVSEHRVETKFPNGTVEANHLDVAENGALVLFSQGVETFLVLDGPKSTDAE